MMRLKLNLKVIKQLRWTVFLPFGIYMGLCIIKLNKNIQLKNINGNGNDKKIENLLFELETVGENKINDNNKSLDKLLTVELNDLKNNNPRLLLEIIFRKADINKNSELDIEELSKWIHAKITEHIDKAMDNNVLLFTNIDNNPRNGEISWDEYHAYFLRLNGLSEKYINYHDRKHSKLPRLLKESIMRDRARWVEVARNDPERLTLDEFLAFTHPESSHRALLQMVEDLFEKFDRDGDELLTEDEFVKLPSDGVGLDLQDEFTLSTVGDLDERRQEFRYLIDKDKDGRANRAELLMYIDPRNPRHAIQEAQNLIELSDTNHDKRLTLNEILSKMDLFMISKMVDTEKSFHDEF